MFGATLFCSDGGLMPRRLLVLTLSVLVSLPVTAQAPLFAEGKVSRVLTIGGSELDPESLWFDQVVGLRVLPGSSIAVVSRKTHNIRVFNASGRLVRTFSRKGEGPGELSSPGELQYAGDRLWLSAALGRVAVFDTTGRHIRTSTPDLDSLRNPRTSLRHQWVLTEHRPPVPKTVRTPLHQLDVQYLLRRARAKPDTVASIALGLHHELRNGIVGTSSQTFRPSGDVATVGDSLIIVADGMAGEVRWIRVDRDSARVVRRESLPFPRRPVTSADLATAVRLMQTSGRGVASDDAPARAGVPLFRPINPPKVWSVAERVLASADGHVWVKAMYAPSGNQTWLLFPPQGPPLRFELPRRFVGYDVAGRRIYGDEAVGADNIRALTVYEVGR